MFSDFLSNIGNAFNPFSTTSGSPFSALFGNNGALSNPTGAWDKFKNGDTNEVNKNIADENLKYQRENLEYQKALQQKIFDREDSSYARTVADMRSAGLSPLSMNGTNGSGEAIAIDPLHNDFQYQDSGNINALSSIFQGFLNARATRAQVDNLDARTEAQKIENKYNEAIYEDKVNSSRYDTLVKQYLAADKKRQNEYNSYFGLHEGLSEKERAVLYAKKALDIGVDMFSSPDDEESSIDRNDFNEIGSWSKEARINDSIHEETLRRLESALSKRHMSQEEYNRRVNEENTRYRRRQEYLNQQAQIQGYRK